MRKLISAVLITLAVAFLAAPAVWTAETIVGTVDKIETAEGTASITVVTPDGQSRVLQVHPSQVEDLEEGDQVEITAEGNKAGTLKKL